jgi:hypothetical protein
MFTNPTKEEATMKIHMIPVGVLIAMITVGCAAELGDEQGTTGDDEVENEDISEADESSDEVKGKCKGDVTRAVDVPRPKLVQFGSCTVAAGRMQVAFECLRNKGVKPICNSSFRTTQEQKNMICSKGCYVKGKGGAACDSASNHQKGTAVDVSGEIRGAGACGLIRGLVDEKWHYSLTGK